MDLTIGKYIDGVKNGKFSPTEVYSYYLNKAKSQNVQYNAFTSFIDEDKIKSNYNPNNNDILYWAPIWIKDLIMVEWLKTTCSCKILENYVAPYSATCVDRLEGFWWTIIWKTNCDQFGMWSSTENTIFWPTINPHGTDRVPGWSSWWSAVAVASDLCLWALWTDTGGSCRQPASLCGVVWLKPSYGRVSRYGVVPYASSFDQVWVLSKTVEDAKLLLQSICWHDEKDATSVNRNDVVSRERTLKENNIKGTKIAIPKQFRWKWLNNEVKQKTESVISMLEKAGAIITEIDIPMLEYVLSIYYILVTAEASTNLSRLDGMRYWLQKDTFKYDNIHEYYASVRSEWFLDETKRRILTWTFVLSSANYEGYYLKAAKARKLLQYEFAKIFKTYDCILWPTSPEVAWKLWDTNKKDPVNMYLADIYTVTSPLVQNCSMSVPVGTIENLWEQMPVGVQIMADTFREDVLFGVGQWIENHYN